MYATGYGATRKYHEIMSHTVPPIQLLAPNGVLLTTRKRLLAKYPTVGFGNLQTMLENDGLTRYTEDNKHYFVQGEVEPIVEGYLLCRAEKHQQNKPA